MTKSILLTIPFQMLAVFAADQRSDSEKLDQVLNEVRDLRRVVESLKSGQASPPASRLTIDTSGFPTIGTETAPIAIVEFMDYECPYCKQFQNTTFADLKRLFIDTGKVRYYSVNMPSDKHPNGQIAAKAGKCANAQGEYWHLREQIGAHPNDLGKEALFTHAGRTRVDMEHFRSCMDAPADPEWDARIKSLIETGIQGTPSFVVGKNVGSLITGELITGAMPLGTFQRAMQNIR